MNDEKEMLKTFLRKAIFNWYDCSKFEFDVEDDEWIDYACSELGMSRELYLSIMI